MLQSNERAIRFYQSNGFYADGAAKVEQSRSGITFHEMRYRCALTPSPLGPVCA